MKFTNIIYQFNEHLKNKHLGLLLLKFKMLVNNIFALFMIEG